MKTLQWIKNSKGEFEQVGSISEKVKWVYIDYLDAAGTWQRVGRVERKAQEAFKIITEAISKKQTGKWHGYRLVPVERIEHKPQPQKKVWEKAKTVEARTIRCTECGSEFTSNVPERHPCIKCSMKKEEEDEVAKTKTKNGDGKAKPEKLLDYFRDGTAMAAFMKPLLDEKVHKLSVRFAAAKAAGADGENRLAVFKQQCKKRNLAGVLVDRDADTIQIKKGKGQPVPGSGKKPAPVAKQTTKAKTNGSATDPTSEVASLVRKLLAKGDDWTKNKVVEQLHKDHQIEQKRITAAIVAEIKAGGILEEKGLLTLSAN